MQERLYDLGCLLQDMYSFVDNVELVYLLKQSDLVDIIGQFWVSIYIPRHLRLPFWNIY